MFEVGSSLEGRSIRGIRIAGPSPDKPALYMQGCQHAREWIAVMVSIYLADALVERYDTDPEITCPAGGGSVTVSGSMMRSFNSLSRSCPPTVVLSRPN